MPARVILLRQGSDKKAPGEQTTIEATDFRVVGSVAVLMGIQLARPAQRGVEVITEMAVPLANVVAWERYEVVGDATTPADTESPRPSSEERREPQLAIVPPSTPVLDVPAAQHQHDTRARRQRGRA